MSSDLLLLSNAVATWFMVGVIWFVQVIHYPLFERASREEFAQFAAAHQNLTSFVVMPAMLLEALTALGLLLHAPRFVEPIWLWLGLGLVAFVWAVTFFVSVPCHATLSAGWHEAAHARLVSTNWLRTFAWSARGVLMAWILLRYLQASR